MPKNNLLEHLNNIKKPWKFLAPMVDNSDHAYRILARRHGAGLCYTEMVNSKVFVKCNCSPTQNQWYTTDIIDRPLVIQICGDNPEIMLETCLSLQDHCDAIDINFGCPQEIARKGHYGAYLQDDWELISSIVSTCASQITVPLFCKIRIFESIEKTVKYAKMFEDAGAALLAVHGRTREQRGSNSGLASWAHIKAIKDALKIPVIANGNMIVSGDIQRCFEATNCDGVMIAEPHLFNPAIFGNNDISALAMFKEYLEIIKMNPRLFEPGAVKSHGFKIFHGLLTAFPDLRVTLGSIRSLDGYVAFSERIGRMVERGEVTSEELRMRPYIRSVKINDKETIDVINENLVNNKNENATIIE